MSNNIFEIIGQVILDSLWQGLIIFALAFLGQTLLRRYKANLRYIWLIACLFGLVIVTTISIIEHTSNLSTTADELSISSTGTSTELDTEQTAFEPLPTLSTSEEVTFLKAPITQWFGVVWFIGTCLISFKTIFNYLHLRKIRTNANLQLDDRLKVAFQRINGYFSHKLKVTIAVSNRVFSPLATGIIKPMIIFPIGLAEGLTTDEIELILLHEIAHLRRNDLLIHMVINVLKIVFFYHPLFWWLESQIDNEREFATDEWALNVRQSEVSLVKALAKTQAFQIQMGAVAFAGNSKHQLLKRINRIMKKQQQPNWYSAVVAVVAICTMLGLMSIQEKQETKPEEPSETIAEPVVTKETEPEINQDTVTLAKAMVEIVSDQSPITTEVGNLGNLQMVYRDGKPLKGEELKIYKEAFEKLEMYSNTVVMRKQEVQLAKQLEQEQSMMEQREEVEKLREQVMARKAMLESKLIEAEAVEEERAAMEKQYKSARNEEVAIEYRARLNQLEQQQAELFEKNEADKQLMENLLVITTISENRRIVEFKEGAYDDKQRLFMYAFERLSFEKGKKLIDMDGELTDMSELDLNDEFINSVKKLDYLSGEEMKNAYSKRKVKGYVAVIKITKN